MGRLNEPPLIAETLLANVELDIATLQIASRFIVELRQREDKCVTATGFALVIHINLIGKTNSLSLMSVLNIPI